MSNMLNKSSFGKKLRSARTSKGLTQFELAEKINISPNFLGDIERGIKLPSLPTLILLCNTLKVSLDYLFAGSLDNLEVEEEVAEYFTDKQLKVMKNVIKQINDNFDIK